MKVRNFVILLVAMFVTACNKPDYFYTTYVNVENKSGVDVELKAEADDVIYKVFSIAENGSIRPCMTNEEDFASPIYLLQSFSKVKYICFGNDVVIDIADSAMNSLGNYTLVKDESYFRLYNYTISAEDYQYALANGKKL